MRANEFINTKIRNICWKNWIICLLSCLMVFKDTYFYPAWCFEWFTGSRSSNHVHKGGVVLWMVHLQESIKKLVTPIAPRGFRAPSIPPSQASLAVDLFGLQLLPLHSRFRMILESQLILRIFTFSDVRWIASSSLNLPQKVLSYCSSHFYYFY
ncbi:hypothetical protein MANES_14G101650v8 [Manihot esculenta]|uniref:Uncharacterized protein n=1 Tax=Manihot esculenta TaxID=3983 RepID=A0ACB7GGI1_MANES|nr:hypothetical protein MANES_14G101650v8 [Manihot esculenta]